MVTSTARAPRNGLMLTAACEMQCLKDLNSPKPNVRMLVENEIYAVE